MNDAFDPYHKWLGIPPKDQPPHFYRLLGIELFESDPDVIDNAATQRMAHVKSFQTGKRVVLSQRLLNEISAARDCLLDPGRKAAYDGSLHAALPAAAHIPVLPLSPIPVLMPPPPAAPIVSIPPVERGVAAEPWPRPDFPLRTRQDRSRLRRSPLLWRAALGGLVAAGSLAAAWVLLAPPWNREAGDASGHSPAAPQSSTVGNSTTVEKPEQKPLFPAPPVANSEPLPASAAADPREPIDALFAKIDQALAMPRWKRTAAAGGNGGGAFEDRPKSPRLLVGFQVTTAPLGGNVTIKSLRPIYRTPGGVVHGSMHGRPAGGQIEVVARKGYAVGGLFAKSGHRVDGFKLVFMRIAADGLDSSDAYQSAWIGGQGGGAVVEYTANGKPVVGIFGREGIDLDGVGLVLLAE